MFIRSNILSNNKFNKAYLSSAHFLYKIALNVHHFGMPDHRTLYVMKHRYCITTVLLIFPLFLLAETSQLTAEKAFNQARTLIEEGNHLEAIPLLEHTLSLNPNVPSALWNLGTSAIITEQYTLASKTWERYKRVEPDDWQVLPKLIQAYQGTGESKKRDDARDQLFALHKEKDNTSLKKQDRYCREQYPFRGGRVYVYEYFEPLATEWAKYFEYIVTDKDSNPKFSVSMGSYDSTNAMDLEMGNHKANERLYHFDAYFVGGKHSTLGFYVGEEPMSFDKAREIMMSSVVKINAYQTTEPKQ